MFQLNYANSRFSHKQAKYILYLYMPENDKAKYKLNKD